MRWIENEADFDQLLADLAFEPRYALDTEFHGERSYFPVLALVQIAWPGDVALIDPYEVDISNLSKLFSTDALMVAHAASADLSILDRECGVIPTNIFDTQIAGGFVGFGTPSLMSLVDQMLGVKLSKADQLADWTRRPLSAEAQKYAAADVDHLLDLHDALVSKLESKDRLDWALDECAVLRDRERSLSNPKTAWWKLKGARTMKRGAKAIAQEVGAWRELRARASNVPPRFVLPDLALLSIAARPPKNADELRNVRGLDHRGLRDAAAAELLNAIEAGKNLPDAGVLTPESSPDRPSGPVVTLIMTWIAQLASDLHLDPSLLATRSDIEEFMAPKPRGRLCVGWRHDVVAAPIEALRSGRASIALQGSRLVLRD